MTTGFFSGCFVVNSSSHLADIFLLLYEESFEDQVAEGRQPGTGLYAKFSCAVGKVQRIVFFFSPCQGLLNFSSNSCKPQDVSR